MIGANQDTVFARLCEAMQSPQLASDPRYRDHQARGAHQQELDEIIAQWTATLGTRELLDVAGAARRALGPHLPRGRHARRPALRGARSHRQHPASALRHAAHAERRAATVGHARARSARRRPSSASTMTRSIGELLGLDPTRARRVSRQRRDLSAQMKKAGRLHVRPFMIHRLADWLSGVEQPELGDAHHGRVAASRC